MAEQPVLLTHATYRDLRDAAFDIAVLPWAATEPHNYHLPYGTDIIETEHMARVAAEKAVRRGARVIVLPAVPFGVNTGQIDLPLTINMNPSTQMALLRDVSTSLERQGVPRLVILNGHGGNDFRQMIRELSLHHRLFICVVNWYKVVDHAAYFETPGDHADEMETSFMLHISPTLVRPLAEAGEGRERRWKIAGFRAGWAWAPRDWRKVTEDTGTGDPRRATAAKGKAYVEAVSDRIGEFLHHLAVTSADELYEDP
jgi:creatinine amidohydrolase